MVPRTSDMIEVLMHAVRSLAATPHRLVWLVWLALLLPVAQSAAIWHAYSHQASYERADAGGNEIPPAASCDLCLAAAGLSGGGLPAASPPLALVVAHDELPAAQARSLWLAPFAPAYMSRAPPLTSL
jgi:hypothetical protein